MLDLALKAHEREMCIFVFGWENLCERCSNNKSGPTPAIQLNGHRAEADHSRGSSNGLFLVVSNEMWLLF